MKSVNNLLWYGKKTKREAIEFTSGWDNKSKEPCDNLLIPYEIKADIIYCSELYKKKYITKNEFDAIKKGLSNLYKQFSKDKLSVINYEDVHSLIESRLIKKHGSLAQNLNLGKSRNEQICTIMRMWMRDEAVLIIKEIENFISVLNSLEKKKGKLIIPGFTHHRIAMPTTYGNLLNSYVSKLKRNLKNMEFWISQYNKCPLGSGAGYGSLVKLNFESIAKELGFSAQTENSIDAVTTRWEAEVYFAFSLALLENHLSTIAQDFVYLSSTGIEILRLPEEYCTGSSLMPQKNNPDVLEVIKAKASVANGIVTSLLSIGKGNISGYNRDTQWTKYLIMDLVKEFEGLFPLLSKIIKKTKVNEEQSKKLLEMGKAYSAEEVLKEAIKTKKGFRKTKLMFEKNIKASKRMIKK